MSEAKTYIFPDNVGGVDPNLMLAMNNGGMGGNNLAWILLVLLFGWNRNSSFLGGSGCNGGGVEREMILSAINGNGNAVSNLATSLHSDFNSINGAISQIQTALCGVGNSVGLTGQQIINSIQSGNMSLASQLAQCCCDNKLLQAQNQGALMSRIDQFANGVTQGFSATSYETAQQTCSLQNTIKDSGTANTNAILAKLDQMENAATQDKINALTAQNTALMGQISQEQQNQAIKAMIDPLQAQINAMKNAMPSTTTVQYPQLTAVPSYYLNGGMGNNGFWY